MCSGSKGKCSGMICTSTAQCIYCSGGGGGGCSECVCGLGGFQGQELQLVKETFGNLTAEQEKEIEGLAFATPGLCIERLNPAFASLGLEVGDVITNIDTEPATKEKWFELCSKTSGSGNIKFQRPSTGMMYVAEYVCVNVKV